MLRSSIAIISTLALAISFASVSRAAGPKIDAVMFGESLVGTKIDKDAIKGRPVLVELWGVH